MLYHYVLIEARPRGFVCQGLFLVRPLHYSCDDEPFTHYSCGDERLGMLVFIVRLLFTDFPFSLPEWRALYALLVWWRASLECMFIVRVSISGLFVLIAGVTSPLLVLLVWWRASMMHVYCTSIVHGVSVLIAAAFLIPLPSMWRVRRPDLNSYVRAYFKKEKIADLRWVRHQTLFRPSSGIALRILRILLLVSRVSQVSQSIANK